MADMFFRALLRLYPRDFRERYGTEQLEYLRQDWKAHGSEASPVTRLVFWMKTALDALGAALRIRLRALGSGGASNSPGHLDPAGKGDSRRWALWEEGLQDVRFALRTLRKQPTFTLVAVGVLGLGVGASTTLFSAVNGVLLQPLQYPEQDRLVFLGSKYPEGTHISGISIPELMDVEREVGGVEALAAVRGRALDLVGEGEPERVAVAEVSPDYFRVLGTTPAMGPGFSPEAHLQPDSRVIMISHGLWRRRWGGDPDIVGQTVPASDGRTPGFQNFTIVGVLPPGFENPPPLENPYSRLPAADIWAPLPLGPEMYTTSRTNWTIRAVGLLGEGRSVEALNAELDGLALSLKELYPNVHVRGDTYLGLGGRPLLEEMVGQRRGDLMILLGATGLLLLIACANVAGLMVARSLDRRREMGLRTALGAGRSRLFRQLLTESLILALLGGAVGIVIAILGVGAFQTLGPEDFPRLSEINLDLRVLSFGLVVAVVTGLLFGMGPAMAGSREEEGSGLVTSVRGAVASKSSTRIRGGLVAVEVALALMLLTGCGLLTRSVVLLQSRDPGVEAERLALMQVRLLPSFDEDRERSAFFSELRDRLQGLPGVESVSFVADPPMAFNNWAPGIWKEADAQNEEPTGGAAAHPVGLDYFRTMGIPLQRGRVFDGTDTGDSPPVAVVSETLAEGLWPGEDPLGKRLGVSIDYDGPWVTVVGVVGDIRQRTLASDRTWDLYLPHAQNAGNSGQYMAIRTVGEPLALADAFRRAVWSLDPNVPVPEITTMEARIAATLRLPRFRTLLLASFALIALLLSATGIYGTLMYTVGRRGPEVGIRMALGAEGKDVVGLVLRQGLWPVVLGIGLGLAGSFAATRLLESVLFDTTPNDPSTFVAVSAFLAGVSLIASYLPARKASRIDPQEALRGE